MDREEPVIHTRPSELDRRNRADVFFGLQAPGKGHEPKYNPYYCWQLGYYSQYFDLSTSDACRRIMRAMWPFFKESFVEAEGSADLYVPVWTYLTLVITMSTFGSLVASIKKAEEDGGTKLELQLDADKIMMTSTIFGFFFFLNPFLFTVLFKCTGSAIGLFQLLCMVGYSFVPFVPVSFLFVLPYATFRAALLIGASCMGMHFLYRNLGGLTERYLKEWTYFVRAYMILIQVVLIFVIYFVFFS